MRLSSVDITREEIAEYDGKLKIISIDSKVIDKIELKFGIIGERFVSQILLAFGIIGLGIVFGILPLVNYLIKNDYPDTILFYKHITYALSLLPIGIYLLFRLYQRRFFLLVKTGDMKRKVIFKEKIDSEKIMEYLNRANKNFDYDIQTNI